jgi:hypothetical protein
MTASTENALPQASRNGWTSEVRAHVFDAIESVRREMSLLFAERDKRYEERSDAQDNAVAAALASSGLAVDKAEKNTREWQQAANEWRGSMNDREARFMAKEEVNLMVGALDARVNRLEESAATGRGHSQGLSMAAGVAFGICLILADVATVIVAVLVHH